jgi:hypothetical protein
VGFVSSCKKKKKKEKKKKGNNVVRLTSRMPSMSYFFFCAVLVDLIKKNAVLSIKHWSIMILDVKEVKNTCIYTYYLECPFFPN